MTLNRHQSEVCCLILLGKSRNEASAILGRTRSSIDFAMRQVFDKLGIDSYGELWRWFLLNGGKLG